jgi:hypothetical protein
MYLLNNKNIFIIILINIFYINIIKSNKFEICINKNDNNCIIFLNKSLGYNYLLDNKSKQHQCNRNNNNRNNNKNNNNNNNFTLTYTSNRHRNSNDKSISVGYTIAVGSYRGNIKL